MTVNYNFDDLAVKNKKNVRCSEVSLDLEFLQKKGTFNSIY